LRVYYDSSALLKRYLNEPESEFVLEHLREPDTKLASPLILVELSSVFRRLRNGRKISAREHARLNELARQELRSFGLQSSSEELFRQAAVVADLTGLKSLDAIHLASARMAGADLVLTFDREMALAAKKIGLKTAP
jgi:predicted nucleic acid-binding protein